MPVNCLISSVLTLLYFSHCLLLWKKNKIFKAIVIFLISSKRQNIFLGFEKIVLLGLIGLSIALDAWALSALAYRISEWGISANKTAVLLENVCILMHLIAIGLFQLFKSDQPRLLESITHRFLIVYALVFAAVCFLFPWVFK